jgi:thiol-disulfide isomerase/thioredoxin
MKKKIAALLVVTFIAVPTFAADLVRGVRFKISAGDLATGMAQVEDYKRASGVDNEYLDAVGWLARGAEMLGRRDLARDYCAELRREIPVETPEHIVPLGAAIEVEGKLIAAREGRGAAIRFLNGELARATAPALRSRISKNINLLSLEGQPAPAIDTSDFIATLAGKPALLFFFAYGCGDCKAQAPSLGRVWQKYRSRGLAMVAVTRYYGTVQEKPATPAEEKAEIEKVWKDLYAAFDGVPVVISTDAMVRYGVSATPTFALVDRKGIVRLYTPTRLSEAELSRRIEEVLGEAP